MLLCGVVRAVFINVIGAQGFRGGRISAVNEK